LAELTIDALRAKKTPINPTSVFPTAVNRVLAENGVTIAQPGSRSFVLRSIEYIKFSSLTNLLYKVFWCLETNNLQRQASLVNFKLRQFANIRCCIELELNIEYNFWSKAFIEINLRFINVSFLEKLKKTDMKEFSGDMCTEFQLSISASFRLS
jgi:hypothetical protein